MSKKSAIDHLVDMDQKKEDNLYDTIINKARQKETQEDTHKRKTFMIRRDLDARLDKVAEQMPYGFYREFFNSAIEKELVKIEKELEKRF